MVNNINYIVHHNILCLCTFLLYFRMFSSQPNQMLIENISPGEIPIFRAFALRFAEHPNTQTIRALYFDSPEPNTQPIRREFQESLCVYIQTRLTITLTQRFRRNTLASVYSTSFCPFIITIRLVLLDLYGFLVTHRMIPISHYQI